MLLLDSFMYMDPVWATQSFFFLLFTLYGRLYFCSNCPKRFTLDVLMREVVCGIRTSCMGSAFTQWLKTAISLKHEVQWKRLWNFSWDPRSQFLFLYFSKFYRLTNKPILQSCTNNSNVTSKAWGNIEHLEVRLNKIRSSLVRVPSNSIP